MFMVTIKFYGNLGKIKSKRGRFDNQITYTVVVQIVNNYFSSETTLKFTTSRP